MRKLTAQKINEGVTAAKRKRNNDDPKYKIGQQVMIYVAPGQNQARARNRRIKHMLRFRGPATVVKKLSNTTFELRMNSTRRMFQRSVVNMRPFPKQHLKHPDMEGFFDVKGNLIDEKDDTTYHFGKWNTGDIIAVIEKEGDKNMHIGKVVNSRGRNNKIHVYATTSWHEKQKSLAIERLAPA